MISLPSQAKTLVAKVSTATAASSNEANLRHEIEKALEVACSNLNIPWTPFTLDLTLRGNARNTAQFVDVVHGAVVIECEPPRSFGGITGARLNHAREQAEDYAQLMHIEEGRPLEEYILVAWDGDHISFGRYKSGQTKAVWETLVPFDYNQSERLLRHLNDDGQPLVHPRLLSALIGPETEVGGNLIPKFFETLVKATNKSAPTTKTKLLFTEWSRLFGQVVGVQSSQLQRLLARQGLAHNQQYIQNVAQYVAQYLFALNTHIALVAKLVAALALPDKSQDILNASVPIKKRLQSLEDGTLFFDAGISNMLIGDFFSWYLDDGSWMDYKNPIENLLIRLSGINFDVTQKNPQSTRDLFKGMYENFVPRELRHALGEVYTPDWLAAHALDELGWKHENELLDPTCGTGTFILEAIRRRLTVKKNDKKDVIPKEILSGLYGIDLNPLAVLAARASIVVFLAPYLNKLEKIRLPIFLADAINSADPQGEFFVHNLQTELGAKKFTVPSKLVKNPIFHEIFGRVRELINAGVKAGDILSALKSEYNLSNLKDDEMEALNDTLDTLESLHSKGWDGIWCSILADRFVAGSIPKLSYIAGNPPWVKWSHLPPEYANFIKDRCLKRGVFSHDKWVGGIESDISTVITFESISKWLKKNGKLGFFITGTVFSNESSQGFRRLHIEDSEITAQALEVQDFRSIAPFDGVTNHPTLLLIQYDGETKFPIPYVIWEPAVINGRPSRMYTDAQSFRSKATRKNLLAAPVPGTDAGPWIKGNSSQHAQWKEFLDGSHPANYVARKGITTDRNGIFFVRVLKDVRNNTCEIENDPAVGRIDGIPRIRASVEKDHIFPLIRGRGVKPFVATPDPNYSVVVPQRGMHGDPNLPVSAPKTYRYLKNFKDILEQRSSLKRFQRGQVYWSLWSTGAYTFSPFKVVWREMSGGRFSAAYIGSVNDPVLGKKIVIPDHKLYFVPVQTEDEAAFIVGILNAPDVSEAISAYSAQLSLGVSVVEYLKIPGFDTKNKIHLSIVDMVKNITFQGIGVTRKVLATLNGLVHKVF